MTEVLKLALYALKLGDTVFYPQTSIAIAAIEAALAKQDGQSNFCAQCEAFARELKVVKQALAAQPAQEPEQGPVFNKLLAYVCNVPDDGIYAGELYQERHSLIDEAKVALAAQPAQEPVQWSAYEYDGIHHKPVAWMDRDGNFSDNNDHKCFPIPLYTITHPPAAQPEQEPVAWMDIDEKGGASGLRYWSEPDNRHEVALYTTPQQRPWVGLTEAQFLEAARLAENGNYLVAFVRIQEWLKEQNT
jgi:hypothetical protein